MTATAIEWNSTEAKTNANGSSRKFFEGPTATLDLLECHASTLNPGATNHVILNRPHDEVIIVKEGTIEAFVTDKWVRIGPGSVIFNAANVPQAMRNVGDGPATYHVVMFRPAAPAKGVTIVPNEAARRVDVLVDGQPFTSYIWPDTLKKPVLFPLRAASGTIVTRGFPLEPRAGERVDHPHHVGLWFNYENVNGVDFWNNSTALPAEQQAKMGTIVHRRIVKASGGADQGELEVEMDWMMPDGQPILHETTDFIFRTGPGRRVVDRISTLTALDKPVVFKDNKDGLLGLRVRRELEQPSNEAVTFTDASGHPTTVKAMDTNGVSGLYHSSEGKTGDAVWGTRGRWTMLSGKMNEKDVTLLMLDHPQNAGFPTYWHARGYGLFAANPLGQEIFSKGKEKLNFTLQPKESATFRYRLVILDGATTSEQADAEYRQFMDEVK